MTNYERARDKHARQRTPGAKFYQVRVERDLAVVTPFEVTKHNTRSTYAKNLETGEVERFERMRAQAETAEDALQESLDHNRARVQRLKNDLREAQDRLDAVERLQARREAGRVV
jgi:hypothetical protein